MSRPVLIVLGALVTAAVLASPASAKAPRPDATLTMKEGSVAVGIGFSWGSGTLNYRGKSYRFKVSGLTVITVGGSTAEARGNVYNLKKLSDFSGIYTSIAASGTAGGGKGISRMKNANGVSITLHSVSKGLEATAGPEGVTLTLE